MLNHLYTNNQDTTVSVIVPAFNAAETIAETLMSVMVQHLPDVVRLEIIVADDGSADDTRELVESLALHDDHIRLLPPAYNAGPAAARNRGAYAAVGDYLLFLDADDCLAQGFLWTAAQILSEQQNLAAIVTGIELMDCHRHIEQAQINAMVWSMPSNMVIRRSIYETLGGWPEDNAFRGSTGSEDQAFKHVLTSFFRVGYIGHPFLKYRVSRGSHFDTFLNRTRVVGDEMHYIHPMDAAVDAATGRYVAQAHIRMQELDAARVAEPEVVAFEHVNSKMQSRFT